MNEITRIHLGRQPFTIAVDAHKALQEYLQAIKTAVGPSHKEVIEEVELRMAELLTERGITADKTVLQDDVAYLKEQLGEPGDFRTDDDENPHSKAADAPSDNMPKRLYRDTDNAMVAGVSAGLANYIGIDPVVVRIIFVIGLLTGGWSIPVYLLLWLIVPEAKTTSEKLQMKGKAVTVDSLKELVDQADVQGAAARASTFMKPLIELIGIILLWCVGSVFVVFGIATFMTATVVGVGALINQDTIFSQGQMVITARDYLFGAAVWIVAAIVGVLMTMVGIGATQKKWRLPGWATAVLISLLFISGAVAGTLAPGIYDKGRDYARSLQHDQSRVVPAFTSVQVVKTEDGQQPVQAEYVQADTYKVKVHYVGDADPNRVKTTVKDGSLTIDATAFDNTVGCRGICLIDSHDLRVTVYAPEQPVDLNQQK